jgi:hypothetical protein
MPPPPHGSLPRGRSPPSHGSAAAAGSGAGVALSVDGAASVAAGVALLLGVVFAGFLLPHAGAPSIAPANTTVRQMV